MSANAATSPEPARSDGRAARTFEQWLLHVFGLKRLDRAVLVLVAPLFAIVTASSVMVATFTKSVFLSEHDIKTLPAMFLGSSLFTAVASVGYVALVERASLTWRALGLIVVCEVSFLGLHLLYPLNPMVFSLIQLIWCTGLSQIVLMQTWNMMSALVPARQGKRLFPVLAAVSTLGAAVGGWLVSLLLKVTDSHSLMLVVLALLAYPLARMKSIMHDLKHILADGPEDTMQAQAVTSAAAKTAKNSEGNEIVRGFRNIWETPLLIRLAGLVFLLQVASLILDFQFSTELKLKFKRDEIASFLGTYYGIANIVAFCIALFATGRIVRLVGIGMSISASAVFVAIGSGVYFVLATAGGHGAFYAIVAASFFERLGQFALTRNAMQMLVAPLDAKKGERAKTLIDGVVYRVATALVSLCLLAIAPTQATLGWLAPAAILACIGAVALGLSVNPHYRRALFEGLRARRVDSDADPQTRELLIRTAIGEVRQKLASGNPKEISQALEIVEESMLPVVIEDLAPVARHEDPEVARHALEVMNDLSLKPDRALLLELLTKDRHPAVLREVLRLLTAFPDMGLMPLVTQFVHHADVGVARLAVMWLKLVGADDQTAQLDADLLNDLKSAVAERRARAAFISGGFALEGGFDLSRLVEDPSPEVRLNAVQSMGQIGSPEFVDPLIRAMGRADLVPAASNALQRYGTRLVGAIQRQLASTSYNVAIQLRLLRVVEKVGTREAVDFLIARAEAKTSVVGNNAIQSLWRMAREPERPRPSRQWVRERVLIELERLKRYQLIEALASGMSRRHVFFLGELNALRSQSERRTFRLLGLIYPRAAMHRAFLHYRSPAARVRSTAVELLDQHLVEPDVKAFVALVERSEGGGTGTNISVIDGAGGDSTGAELTRILRQDEPWLARVWSWVQPPSTGVFPVVARAGASGDGPDGGGSMARDPMQRVFTLKNVPLLSDLSGEQLLPVSDIVQDRTFEPGDLIFQEGDPGDHLYVIEEGEVDVLKGGVRVATLGMNECFGEMALLDSSPRSASVRARRTARVLVISRDDFQDLLDMHPALARGVIRVLTQRLRAQTQSADNKHG
ncbi:MAG: cyclic nucleotide-binding domain-containing protein [Myxococcales bacterium]|nr:cyclic nucleotide-binding domain-containing protein [Myxococcales bacterium]